jgi:hypothetical protein
MKCITEGELLEQIKLRKIDLRQPSLRRISPLQVISEIENKARFTLISIPEKYSRITFLQVLLDSFCTLEYVLDISISEKNTRRTSVLSFLTFALDELDSNKQLLTADGIKL